MTKPKWEVEDQLVLEVRNLINSQEPRPEPVNPHANTYGVELVDCPVCGNSTRVKAYNSHWSYYHGTRFWKEKALIKLISEATK